MQPTYENWKIVREIGKGSFGTVYEIERTEFGHTYRAALKVISIPQERSEIDQIRSQGMSDADVTEYYSGMVEDCVREIDMMSRMQGHTNIVNYQNHEVRAHTERVGWDILLRMELLTSLNQYITTHSLTLGDVVQIGVDVCSALERCQKLNVIHRDIKPANIFISKQGDFKLGDFGIARTAERTLSGMSRKGTYPYMAPEVYLCKPYSYSADLYSLGMVLYHLLNNNRGPFMPPYPEKIRYQDSEQALTRRMSGEPLPMPSQTQGRLAEIVLKACAFDPDARYSSAEEMREDLEAFLKESAKGDAVVSRKEEQEKAEPPAETAGDQGEEPIDERTVSIWDEKPDNQEQEQQSDQEPDETAEKTTVVGSEAREKEQEAPPSNEPPKKPRPWKKIALVACAAIALLCGSVFGVYRLVTVPVPDVVDLSVAEAEEVLKAKGLILEEGTPTYSEDTAKGKVASCAQAGKRAMKGDVLTVSVSLGKQTKLKDYTGKQAKKVNQTLTKRGITVKEKKQYSTQYEKGQVIQQSLKKGTKLEEGDKVTLTISKGPKPVKLEDFTGLSEKEAVQKAEKLNLQVKTKKAFSTTAQKGNVAEQTPKAGKTIQEGDTLTLTISKGAEQVTVPDLLGKTRAEAESALKAAGLTVGTVTNNYSSSYAYGKVCTQGRTAGTTADKGSSVNFGVSIGAKPAYSGTSPGYYSKQVSLTKLTSPRIGYLKAEWGKVENCSGYQMQISLKSSFPGAKAVKISKSKTTYIVNGLKSKQKYYVRIRAYGEVGSKTYYGAWSKAKIIKVK